MKVLETQNCWFVVIYIEDKETVQKILSKLIADGIYDEKL